MVVYGCLWLFLIFIRHFMNIYRLFWNNISLIWFCKYFIGYFFICFGINLYKKCRFLFKIGLRQETAFFKAMFMLCQFF